MRRSIATFGLILACASLSACGDDQEATDGDRGPVIRPLAAATIADLTGPWRAQPLGLDPDMASRIATHCARDMEGPPGVPVQIIDVRGAAVAMARLSGPTAAIGCDALLITENGGIEGAGGGWRSERAENLPPIGMTEIIDIERSTVAGGNLKVQGWSVMGRAGAGIASVTVEPIGHPVIVATVQNGWFAAWWPVRPGEPTGDRRDHPPVRIRAFDARGDRVAEETFEAGS